MADSTAVTGENGAIGSYTTLTVAAAWVWPRRRKRCLTDLRSGRSDRAAQVVGGLINEYRGVAA
jgi:hypothetical protein